VDVEKLMDNMLIELPKPRVPDWAQWTILLLGMLTAVLITTLIVVLSQQAHKLNSSYWNGYSAAEAIAASVLAERELENLNLKVKLGVAPLSWTV